MNTGVFNTKKGEGARRKHSPASLLVLCAGQQQRGGGGRLLGIRHAAEEVNEEAARLLRVGVAKAHVHVAAAGADKALLQALHVVRGEKE